jgi:hypothetical protein
MVKMALATDKHNIYNTFNKQFAKQITIINCSIKDGTFYYTTDDTNLCVILGDSQNFMVTCQTYLEYDILLSYVKYLHTYYKSSVFERKIFDEIYGYLVTNNVCIDSIFYMSNDDGDKITIRFNNKEKYMVSEKYYRSSDRDLSGLSKSFQCMRKFSGCVDYFNRLYNLKCIAHTHKTSPYIVSSNKNQYDNRMILDIIDSNSSSVYQYAFAFANKDYGDKLIKYMTTPSLS